MISVFPNIEDRFTQRKNYDEYYYTETTVEIDIEQIRFLTNNLGYMVEINWLSINIK
jgi:flagellar basal body rod protein FlgB